METNNKPLTYAKVKNYIKQLIKLIDNRWEFDELAKDFYNNCNYEDRANKLSFINYYCREVLNEFIYWSRYDNKELISALIHEYAKHLYKVDWSNSDEVHNEIRKEFGKWATR